jgi:phytoene dehydrogenase-like protein
MPKIIIIGGGISGLTAGIYAKNAGFDVEIYESHTAAGGLCGGWKRNGYLVAGGVHWLTGIKKSSALHKMWEDIGAIDENTEIYHHDIIASCKNEGTYHHLYTDLTKLEEEFLSISPEDTEATKALIRAIKIHQGLPVPVEKPMDFMEEMEKLIFFAPYMKAEKAFPTAGMSIADYASRFRSPVIRDLLLSVVPNTNVTVRTLLKWLAINCGGDAGFPISGFGAMAQRMKNKFEKLGGQLFFESKVKRINVANGVAVGVELENGAAVSADYVISTASPDVWCHELLDNKYEDVYFEKRFNNFADFPTFALTLIPLIIDTDMSKFPRRLYFTPKQPVVVNKTEITCLKINHYGYESAFCQNGKTLAEVFLHSSEYEYWRDLKASSPQAYKEVKEKIATHVIAEVEAVYPETRGKIKLLDVATPVTFQRYTGNFRGSYVPFCITPNIEYENHPGVIAGVKNLYLAGQWVFPDGGLPMAAIGGKYAVQRICNQENRSINL